MATRNSAARRSVPAGSNNLRAPELDAVDRRILRVLAHDARVPNNALAEHVGIAPSTALGRVRALRERGVIRGYHADIDPVALGRSRR
jgi:DNA-binding Lrp family transcriptional regulator